MRVDSLSAAVRPVITILLVVTMCAGFWAGKISSEQFGSAVLLATGFWFGSREAKK